MKTKGNVSIIICMYSFELTVSSVTPVRVTSDVEQSASVVAMVTCSLISFAHQSMV